ncbi:MAG: universal stress protein [Motiliproteus sp.]|nr:universal stress protein [Motiliproteus sp.]MCW9053877.1 universal stress protein [Motiliproteus sp.]
MFSKILLPIDLESTEFSDRALELALKGAHQSGTQLHLLAVTPGHSTPVVAACFQQAAVRKATRDAEKQLETYALQHLPKHIEATLTVLDGDPAEQVLSHARNIDADLMILAAHNRAWMDEGLLGSTSSRLVERARCSVVVLRREQSGGAMATALSG